MDSNRIEGIGHQVKGAVMEGLGKAIGDAKLAADGAAERAIGDEQNVAKDGADQLIGVDADRVKGIAHQAKGALIQGFGAVIGNPKLAAEGVAERLGGVAQNAAGSARDLAREELEKQRTAVEHLNCRNALTRETP
ncbi:CsbD family protein [Roseiarcus sp.]|jgi:uncharacterized protein YjbJ (UPF0337 family)|uniref:CsbD family protein n=1 Tax=Roseiarcus sp. TaxID=1969460 RepID=UPI003D143E52